MREWIVYAAAGGTLLALLFGISFCSDSSIYTRSNSNAEAERGARPSPSDRIPARVFRHNIKIEEKHDKFLGINSIDTRQMQVAGTLPEGIQMSAMFAFKSDKERGSFLLTFIVSGKYANFMEHSSPDVRLLLAVADGQRIDLGNLKVVDSRSDADVYLLTTPDIPKQTFIQLVSAKEVQMRLGSHEFKLSEEYLEAMRDVASRATR